MRAFTLIETLIYVALFSLLISGLLAAADAVRRTADRNDTQAFLLEEGTYLLETLAHAADGGTIDRYRISDGRLMLDTQDGPKPISGNQVEVKDFSHTKITDTTDGSSYLDIHFMLEAYTANGMVLLREFEEQIYLFTP